MAKEIEFAMFPLGESDAVVLALHQVVKIEKVEGSGLALTMVTGEKVSARYSDDDAREQHLKSVIRPLPLTKKGSFPVGF